jgi:uncharacterized protein (TIGR03067 family)
MAARLGLLLVLCSLAFAPAPLPRTPRRPASDEITLASFQGSWRATKMVRTLGDGQTTPQAYGWTHARIVGDRWTFMVGSQEGSTLRISIDNTRKPAFMNFHYPPDRRQVYGVALIRRHQGKVEVMYRWGGEAGRPTSFDRPPNGLWIVTLEK